jgi:hypothetical protein
MKSLRAFVWYMVTASLAKVKSYFGESIAKFIVTIFSYKLNISCCGISKWERRGGILKALSGIYNITIT